MKRRLIFCFAVLASIAVFGCQSKEKADTETATAETKEPDYISVQHILIAFEGTLPGQDVARTQDEARQLARDILERAKAGEDFDALVKEYTDDSYPGVYKMANFGVPDDMANRVYARGRMVQAFGDVGFPLKVGEIGLAEYEPIKSKYGWHIIKRVE